MVKRVPSASESCRKKKPLEEKATSKPQGVKTTTHSLEFSLLMAKEESRYRVNSGPQRHKSSHGQEIH